MYLQKNVLLLCFVTVAVLPRAFAVSIENNGYRGVTIAFSPSIQENEINSTKLKNVFQKSSELLYRATRKRAFFSEIDLLYPSTWSDNAWCQDIAESVHPQGISIYVTNSQKGDEETLLRAQHSKGCGEKGEAIYMSSAWLNGDNEEELAREFIQQWAMYRYGVFEEKMEPGDWPCFTKDGEHWIQNGCYNIDINVDLVLDSNGLPSCDPVEISDYVNMKSSLMSSVHSANITDFCDGSELLRHNSLAPTRHNRICRGKPVWSVIKESEDFRYGRNLPRKKDGVPRVSFRCLQESTSYIIFSVQRTKKTESKENMMNVERIITDLRLALLRFLVFDAWHESEVSIIAFYEKAESPIHLNLTLPNAVYKDLDAKIRSFETQQDVCLFCGLQAAFNLSRRSERKNVVVVLVAFASALKSHNLGQFIYLMESSPSKTYLVIIQDVQEDFTASNLVRAIHRTGGEVFTVQSTTALLVTKLSMYLTSVLRNPLNLQHNVAIIHQESFFNIKGTVTEIVEADNYLEGEMTYTVICDSEYRLTSNDTGTQCISLPYMGELITKISCGYSATLAKEKGAEKWTFYFHDRSGISSLSCSSIATVQLRSNASDSLTVRGWLNTDTFEPGIPGRNVLIIYAEVMHNSIAITNAVIYAAIYNSSDTTPEIVELLDSGNGDPDIKKEDGIYSRYFTRIYNRGIHSVIIHAKGNLQSEDPVKINPGHVRFSRVIPIGSFLVTEKPNNVDYYPPNRIGDLKVTHIDHKSSVATLQWTAPGDNYDEGTANRYELKFSQSRRDLDEPSFEFGNSTSLENVSKDILPSGDLQIYTIQLPPTRRNTQYYVAIRAINKNDDVSLASNIVQIPFSKTAPVHTTEVPDVSQVPINFTSTKSVENISELTKSTQPTATEEHFNTTEVSNKNSSLMVSTLNATTTVDITSVSITVEPPININTTVAPIAEKSKNSCDKKYIITLVSAAGGGILLFILIMNAIACHCIKKRMKPKRLSKRACVLPPHNMTIVPRESPTDKNDNALPAARENFSEDLQDFEVDSDYTFVPGRQSLKYQDHKYYATETTLQADDAVCPNTSLTPRYNIPEDPVTDSVHSRSAAQHGRNDRKYNTETHAISLGLV